MIPRIDLHLPTSWHTATVRELELISRVLMEESRKVSTYHPFDWLSVKLSLFFLLTDLEVVKSSDAHLPIEDQYFLCRRSRSIDPWYRKLWRRIRGCQDEPFALYLHQIQSILKEHLLWLEKPADMTIFPYPIYRHRGTTYHGPDALMQDFTWQRYRYASDFWASYMKSSNRLVQMMKDGDSSARDLRKQQHLVATYKSMFLATLYVRRIRTLNPNTGTVTRDFSFAPNQSMNLAKRFRDYPDHQFQVILFWWSGMHVWLQRTFPHCFKRTSTKKEEANPLELYTRTTATMEKYLAMREEDVNRQLYTIIFQHLEDMARESEEMEKIRNKNS